MVLYTYKKGSKQEHIVYFWLGNGSSKDEIGTYGHVHVYVCACGCVMSNVHINARVNTSTRTHMSTFVSAYVLYVFFQH